MLAGRHVLLPVVIDNLNADFTDDIRRAVPLSITIFYAQAFPHQVVVRAAEVDTQPHDTSYISYLVVGIVVVGIMIGSLLQAGSSAAREYETGTIRELLLSPASRWAIVAGKTLGALTLNLLGTAMMLVVVVLVLGVRPLHWGAMIGLTFLIITIFVMLGTLIGMVIRRRAAVVPLSLGVALPLFFLSGAFGPVTFVGPVVAWLARLFPLYYAMAVFQYAFHGFLTTTTSLSANILALVGFGGVAISASAVVLRRQVIIH